MKKILTMGCMLLMVAALMLVTGCGGSGSSTTGSGTSITGSGK